ARGNGAAGELEGLDRPARADPGGWVLAQGLVQGHLELGELTAGELLGGGGDRAPGTVRKLGVLLGDEALCDLWIAGELVEHERDRGGRGVVAREEQRHHLVADLQIAERVP